MSTNIGHGYRLKDMSLPKLAAFCQRFRDALQPVLDRNVHTKVATLAAEIIDFGTCDGKKVKEKRILPLSIAHDYVQKAYQEVNKSGHRNPPYDFECNISVFPIEGKTLAILNTEQQDFIDLWRQQPEVVWYPYWNSTDPPKDVTDEEWERRREDWDRAFPSRSKNNAFTFRCVDEYLDFPDPEVYVPLVPSIRKRVFDAAKDTVFSQVYFPKWKAEHPERDSDPEQLHDVMAALSAFAKWVNNGAGGEVLEAKIDEVAALLKPNLTVVDLLGWNPAEKR